MRLDDFGSEQGGMASGSAVSVDDILSRGVPIGWDEAVAILQELVEIVVADGGDNAPIPGFNDVLIDGDGTMTVAGARRGERGPVAAGRALHMLLGTADVPVPLRLFVTQANAHDTHASLRAFADGLAYFARPGRDELIRSVYARYRATSATTAATPTKPIVSPPLPNRPDQPPTEKQKRRAANWLMPAAVVFGVVSLGAVIWYGMFGGTGDAASVVTKAKAAIATVTPTIKSALESVTSGASTSAEAPSTEEKKPPLTARGRQQASSGNRAARRNAGSGSSRAPAFESLVSPFERSPAASSESAESAASPVPVPSEEIVAPQEDLAAAIYSPADVDVEPPVMLYPSLPPPVFFAKAGESVAFNRMELVIAADGRVERVRLVNGPARMPDMMLLSGAKAWRFAPATRNGEAVRYRTSFSWSGFP
jgi:hypothetical protein